MATINEKSAIIKNAWDNCFLSIASVWLKNESSFLFSLSRPQLRDCLKYAYDVLVKDKSIPELKNIEEIEKIKLWKDSLKYSKDKNERIKICCGFLIYKYLKN